MNKLTLGVLITSLGVLLGACSEPAPVPAQNQEAAAVAPGSELPEDSIVAEAEEPDELSESEYEAEFNPVVTLQELMKYIIDPNAQKLWRAVSYVATEAGVEETMPVTDMDWDELLNSAITLTETANALLIEGRPVADDDYNAQRQEFQLSAEEIQARIARNPEDYLYIARGMQTLVLETLDAVKRRDILALTETGAAINQACEACHASYRFKPQ